MASESTSTQSKSLNTAWNFFKYMAFIVGVALAVLTFVALPYEYILGHGKSALTVAAWTAHGWLFPIYLIATFNLSLKLKWSIGKTLLIMLAGTVPLMSFVAERKVAREVSRVN